MKYLLLLVFLGFIIVGIFQYSNGSHLRLATSDKIIVEFPMINQSIHSPLVVTGKARGIWFFEADFPVLLIDGNGRELASGYALTSQEWMTTDFISFESIPLVFETPETEGGFLILFKDNPSDIRELDDRIIVPVKF